MNIDFETVAHPSIDNRKVTLLFVDNKIDIFSAKFFMHMARYGGRGGNTGGISSHRLWAIRVAELYKYLDEMGVNWRTATEAHVKHIRNTMLCWDKNNNIDYELFEHKPIENDSMNQKINVWFKFYRYMTFIDEYYEMAINTKRIRTYIRVGMLDHLKKKNGTSEKYHDVWAIRVKSSAQKFAYHAISRTEFEQLIIHLKRQDIVYAMIAYLMVETGLRALAAVNVRANVFKTYFKHLNSGKDFDDVIKMGYIAKGGEVKMCDLPIRTIAFIRKQYLSREYIKRKRKYSDRCEHLKSWKYDDSAMWINKNGKVVSYEELLSAFRKASEKMGRTENRITPHWMRHTFATWTVIDYAEGEKINIRNTGVTPNINLLVLLQGKLGHASEKTVHHYIMCALSLLRVGVNKGPISMSLKGFKASKTAQNLVYLEAKIEFGDNFVEEKFDLFKYAASRQLTVNDDFQ